MPPPMTRQSYSAADESEAWRELTGRGKREVLIEGANAVVV
eukprot:CAMPEP_0202016974 /NCGR_PEP_ID=MMETSP0905-20130828/35852_1 /ASSEMBLY_ACC=CAM_ASM_000554 /TAXON_ID=420261 /ORGANISM="Thalassiosira antarctica, Strain CCMP982" /LENGTH=40 /DNA_ID= /DNA_START= /DNA_END= /DNA_ORIENTATION=